MKIAELQDLQKIVSNRTGDYTRAERDAAEKKIATAKITGTVFVPVHFGSGRAKGEAVESIRRSRGLRSNKQAAAAIKAATVVVDGGVTAYTERDIAEAIARDHVGMGSCTDYAVCEADPEAAHDCDISESSGRGWRRLS
jgi:hypothetical protein